MSVTYGDIHRLVVPDNEYGDSPFGSEIDFDVEYFGVRATTQLEIQLPSGEIILTTLRSPGLWGVGNPDEAHLSEVFEDQKEILLAMLGELGAKPPIAVHKQGGGLDGHGGAWLIP